MPTPVVSLRPCVDADLGFLRDLYASTRAEEMAHTPWDTAAIETFLTQQFQAQHDYYQAHFADGQFLVIEAAGQPIGRAYLLWTDSHLQIIDTALLPAWQGQGIGSQLMAEWLVQADALGLSAGLHVTAHNPALRLYQRNGFQEVGENGVYLKMRRPALATATPA